MGNRKAATSAARRVAAGTTAVASAESSSASWRGTWSRSGWPAILSGLALWAAAAPMSWAALGWGLLAWLAPLGWLHVIERASDLNRRDYVWLWVSGCVFWLPSLQGIRLAFPPLYAGWIVLSLYLAVYTPLFVGAARWLRAQRVPLEWAAPISWVAMEVLRSYIITGYAANQLAHTQAHYPVLIQLADQLGSYGVSFLMLCWSAACYQLIRSCLGGFRLQTIVRPLVVLIGVLGLMLGYGMWRLRESDRLAASRPRLLRVLLVQENTPTVFDTDELGLKQAWTRYLALTRASTSRVDPVDLVVWPESTFTALWPWLKPDRPDQLPPDLSGEDVDPQRLQRWMEDSQLEFDAKISMVRGAARGTTATTQTSLAQPATDAELAPALLLGSDALEIHADRLRRYNAALMLDTRGRMVGRYYKMHRVMFGEYIPLRLIFGWIESLLGFQGIDAGRQPVLMTVNEVRLSPSICFESMMPRLLSWQVRELGAAGADPDVLINLTNDSWFHGSSILDHHLACSIFCAVENRRPLLVAANSGLSAEIDGAGRVLQSLDRYETGGLIAQPIADARPGLVQQFGYPLGWACALLVVGIWAIQLVQAVRSRRAAAPAPSPIWP